MTEKIDRNFRLPRIHIIYTTMCLLISLINFLYFWSNFLMYRNIYVSNESEYLWSNYRGFTVIYNS